MLDPNSLACNVLLSGPLFYFLIAKLQTDYKTIIFELLLDQHIECIKNSKNI